MKTIWFLFVLSAVAVLGTHAQVAPENSFNGVKPDQEALTPYTIVERGPHHRVWELVEWDLSPLGRRVAHNRRYVEMETGMHAWRDGQWVDASADVELTADGAAATNTAHQVFFAANVNTAPAILLITPEGKRLRRCPDPRRRLPVRHGH